MDLARQASGIGALADRTRRALYEYVVAATEPVGREQAARAVGVRVPTASFHLDKLVEEGLLAVDYRRLTGRSGPGAGRPSKLYRRADEEFAVSLPPRRYDLVGDILAAAVVRAEAGTPLSGSLSACAREKGAALGGAVTGLDAEDSLAAVSRVLAGQGFEPRVDDDVATLHNCPFDALAREHTALVCGLNEQFVQGVLEGMGRDDVRASLEPEPGSCCVRVRARS